jgi:hypothetical protein
MADGADPAAGSNGPDAVEQLQRALLTLIGAARVALDAVEAMVADRRRLDELAAGGREVVNAVVGTVFGHDPPRQDGPEKT